MSKVNRKKVQSLCKRTLKKCSFKSKNDLANVSDFATWLYIYGYYDEAIAVCDLLLNLQFTGNYCFSETGQVILTVEQENVGENYMMHSVQEAQVKLYSALADKIGFKYLKSQRRLKR